MTDPVDVDVLRAAHPIRWDGVCGGCWQLPCPVNLAADELTALREERDRLREALTKAEGTLAMTKHNLAFTTRERDQFLAAVRAAQAALFPPSEDEHP